MKVPVAIAAIACVVAFALWLLVRGKPDRPPSSVPSGTSSSAQGRSGQATDTERIQAIRESIPEMSRRGAMTTEAEQAVKSAMEADSFRVRARLAAIVIPAVRRGAMTPDEAIEKLTRMREKAPTEDERGYWSKTITAVEQVRAVNR